MEAEKELTLSKKREHYEKFAAIGMPDVKDIVEKMLIARNVVLNHNKTMSLFHSKVRCEYSSILKIKHLTGAREDTLKTAIDHMKKRITFFDITNGTKPTERNIEFLRDIITDLYVEKLVVPKIKQITEWIHDTSYDTSYLLEDLKSLGYIWKRLPGTDARILIENPEQLHNRINYLKKIIEYRRNERCIVYACYTCKKPAFKEDYNLTKYSNSRITFNNRAFAASPSLGLLHWTCYPPSYARFEMWFWNVLLPLLPKSCVVVVNYNDIVGGDVSKVPASSSTKSEMIKWLQAENIPHNPSWHKAELYKLVEAYKPNVRELKALEEYSKTAGHDFLLAPDLIPAINFFSNISEVNMKYMKPEEWLEHDAKLAKSEVKNYQNSIKFEKIIDQMFTMATYSNVEGMCEKFEKYSLQDNEHMYKDFVLK